MAVSAPAMGRSASRGDAPKLMIGGYAAMTESAWMGSVQASEVLEPIRTAPAARRGQVGSWTLANRGVSILRCEQGHEIGHLRMPYSSICRGVKEIARVK